MWLQQTARTPFKRLKLGVSIAATLLSVYGSRQAFAGSCLPGGSANTYICNGAENNATDVTQKLNSGANPLTVTTSAGFGIDTTSTGGNAIDLRNSSGSSISFADTNGSVITGGFNGIEALNNGTGTTSITSTGAISGKGNLGIYAKNSANAADLSIFTMTVSSPFSGIFADNYGTGSTLITNSSDVNAAKGRGIKANNWNEATDLTITANSITAGLDAIQAFNSGKGTTTITTSGKITSTSEVGSGIVAGNFGLATDLIISTTEVTAQRDGINATNSGYGLTKITTTGTVTSTSGSGIVVANVFSQSADLTITAKSISSYYTGIKAVNETKGATIINTTGSVTSTILSGIDAESYGPLTIVTNKVSGQLRGIIAINYGTGETTITSNGKVSAALDDGIIARNSTEATGITINVTDVAAGWTGIYVNNQGTGSTSITVSGSVTGGKGPGIDNYNTHNSSITLNTGSSVSAASGIAIKDGPGDTTVTINTGASATGSIRSTGGSNKIILDGGTLNVATGLALAVDGDVFNHGVINLQNSSVDSGATINGNFTGGGDLLIDTDLATDAADTLAITGNVLAGGTQVRVNDISTGPATGNDITLISVDGTTKAGDFTLATPLVNGAFNYNALSLMGNDWVLQSAGTAGGHAYTPFASGVEALGQSLLTLEALPSLADRTRNRITGANSGDDTAIDTPVWLRIASGKRSIDGTDSTTGANFDTNHWRAQIGVDFTLSDTAASRFVAGVNAGYGQANTDVSSSTGNSKLETENYNLGVSGTWTFINGAYVDLQAQKSWYTTDLSASGAGKVNDISAEGYSASIEAGHKIPLSESLQVTPQAQLIYAKVDSDNFTGANSELVKLSDSNSLKARIGAELAKQFTDDGASQGFILANVIHEFEDETQVNVSGAQLSNSVDDWSAELGAGIRHSWNKGSTGYQLFASITGGSSLENQGDSHSVEGEFGFKVHF